MSERVGAREGETERERGRERESMGVGNGGNREYSTLNSVLYYS